MPQMIITGEELEAMRKQMSYGDLVKGQPDDFPNPISASGAKLVPLFENDEKNNIWTVRGDFYMIPYLVALTNTMTIYKCPKTGELSIFNAFRCVPELEQQILQLGPIAHVVKLGQFHGHADAYYVRAPHFLNPETKKKPKLWTLPGGTVAPATEADEILSSTNLPVEGAKLFHMEGHPFPEGLMTVPSSDGKHCLIGTDSLIHIPDVSIVGYGGRFLFYIMGFVLQAAQDVPQPAALWFKNTGKIMGVGCVRQWYQEIAAMEWTYFVGGHGIFARNVDHQKMVEAMEQQLPKRESDE